jgi:predicted MFS family arabinose efflux permease
MQAGGQFTVFSYMALILRDFIGATPTTISLLFAAFGVTGVIGNVIGTRVMDRIGAPRVGMVAMACMAAALLLWPLTRGSVPMMLALTLLWGLGCFVFNGAQQARLIGMAPPLASASVALNSSALYLGQAFGALAGGIIIGLSGTGSLSPVGLALMITAMAMSQAASVMIARREAAAAAAAAERAA